eukprot:TRINITY_DN1933_c0_g3_i3.p1 TRINITY_DN1933_c0_g3~~TRINITY_DN1933_c0_g3_i3.p1  ORF type:complete len:207 (+),score=-17.99 TRINITY_DN1933_c0_g3_i3:161-781(+)
MSLLNIYHQLRPLFHVVIILMLLIVKIINMILLCRCLLKAYILSSNLNNQLRKVAKKYNKLFAVNIKPNLKQQTICCELKTKTQKTVSIYKLCNVSFEHISLITSTLPCCNNLDAAYRENNKYDFALQVSTQSLHIIFKSQHLVKQGLVKKYNKLYAANQKPKLNKQNILSSNHNNQLRKVQLKSIINYLLQTQNQNLNNKLFAAN